MSWDLIPREAIVFTSGVAFVLGAAGLTWVVLATAERISRRRKTRRAKASRY